jgi:hypothetical protein
MKPKRYLLFQYEQYYPGGGWGDLTGSFDTIEEAATKALKKRRDYNEIIDLETGEEVWSD